MTLREGSMSAASSHRESGIYAIRHKKSGKLYVGSAVNIAVRWREHRWALNNKRHHSPLLQRAWDKYGPKAFEFVILECCPRERLFAREQHFMDAFRSYEPARGYNINRDARTRLGMPLSDEAKAKISAFHKGRPKSEETRARMSAAFRGRRFSEEVKARQRGRKHSEATKAKMSEAAKARKPTRLGAKLSDEAKAKIAAKARGRVTSEETKAKIAASMKAHARTEEHEAKRREAQQAYFERLRLSKSEDTDP